MIQTSTQALVDATSSSGTEWIGQLVRILALLMAASVLGIIIRVKIRKREKVVINK